MVDRRVDGVCAHASRSRVAAEARVERPLGAERSLRPASAARSGVAGERADDDLADLRKSSSSKPRIVMAGVPTRMPEATVGGRSSNGTVFRLTVILTSAAAPPRPSRPLGLPEIDLKQMRVRAAGEHVEAAGLNRLRERVRVRPHLALVVLERLARGDLEAGRLRGDRVASGPPCIPGRRRGRPFGVLLLAEDEPGARARRASCASSR